MLIGGGMSNQKQTMCLEGDVVFILHTHHSNLFENTLYDNIKRVLEKYELKYIEDEKDSLTEYKNDDFAIINIYTYISDETINKHNDSTQLFYFLENTNENIEKVKSITYQRRSYYAIVGDEKYNVNYDVCYTHNNYYIECSNSEDSIDRVLYDSMIMKIENINLSDNLFENMRRENVANSSYLIDSFVNVNTGLHNWFVDRCESNKLTEIRLSDFKFVGQGMMFIAFICNKYRDDRIIKVMMSTPLRFNDVSFINDEKTKFLMNNQDKNKDTHPFCYIYAYKFIPESTSWFEVERCKPIVNWNKNKLKTLLHNVYSLFEHESICCSDFNEGNIMEKSNGEYCFVDHELIRKVIFNIILKKFSNITKKDIELMFNTQVSRRIYFNAIECYIITHSKKYREHKLDIYDGNLDLEFVYVWNWYLITTNTVRFTKDMFLWLCDYYQIEK